MSERASAWKSQDNEKREGWSADGKQREGAPLKTRAEQPKRDSFKLGRREA